MANILVVDDEEAIALVVERSLKTEHLVQVSLNAVEAREMARRLNPDLIILDVSMPGMDGLQLCHILRSDPVLHAVPILFLTARGRTEDKLAGLTAGADDYMGKPFDVRELRLRVKAILNRAIMARDTPLQKQITLGQLILDCQSYQLTTPAKTVRLTPLEFDLIYHLITHPGQVFSGQQLLHDLWAPGGDSGSTDLIRVHIKNLRLKIESDQSHPRYLLTVFRRGYTLALD